MERRRHQRFYFSVPVKYRIQEPEFPEVSWTNFGVLKNISYGGIYFCSQDTPPLEPGHIRDFTFTSNAAQPQAPETTFIMAKGRVIRIEPPKPGYRDIGVALEFISVKFIGDFREMSF